MTVTNAMALIVTPRLIAVVSELLTLTEGRHKESRETKVYCALN